MTCAALGMVIVLAGFSVFHKFSAYNNAVYINNLHITWEKNLVWLTSGISQMQERILPNGLEFITAAAGSGSKGN